MFRAYQCDLSPRGHQLATLTCTAQEKVAAGHYSSSEVQMVEAEVLAHLPNPKGTNLLDEGEKSWINWFDLSHAMHDLGVTQPMGDGCLEPCSFCERGNMSGWVRDNPLYVVAATIKHIYQKKQELGEDFSLFYQGVFGNNVVEWMDPFFHFDIGSLAASLAMLDCRVVFAPIVKPFNQDDVRVLDAARRMNDVNSPNYANSLTMSFHLGIGSPDYDVIRAVALAGGKQIPEEIINRYVHRYAANFMAMRHSIKKIFLYGLGLGIRAGELLDDSLPNSNDATEMFNWVTRQAYIRALSLAGIDIHDPPFNIGKLDRRPLHHGGRGFDFMRRFDLAFYQGKDLEPDQSCGVDLIEKLMSFTRVKRKANGVVLVSNPAAPSEVLVGTTMDELWPMAA